MDARIDCFEHERVARWGVEQRRQVAHDSAGAHARPVTSGGFGFGPGDSGRIAPQQLEVVVLPIGSALADVVVVGRSFGTLWGSDMIEPIALGKATIIGPAVDDFRETVNDLLAGNGIIQTTRDKLPVVLAELLGDANRRAALADRGRTVIRARQGATARQAALILDHLPEAEP